MCWGQSLGHASRWAYGYSPSTLEPWGLGRSRDLNFFICKMETILVLQSEHEEKRKEFRGPAYRKSLVSGALGDSQR